MPGTAGRERVGGIRPQTFGAPRERSGIRLLVEEFGPPVGPGFAPLYCTVPVIGSVQWLFARAMSRKYHLPFHLVEQQALRAYKHLITMTQEMASDLMERYRNLQCWHVPNGLNAEDFVPRKEDSRDVLLLGRLDVDQKGIDLALDMLAHTPNPPGKLLIAGGGPDLPEVLRLISAYGLEDQVTIVGHVRGQTKRDLLARARAVLIPSRHETFGLVALEAFAAGCPIVGFDIPGLREVASGPAARLVQPFDLDQLRHALMEWWSDPMKSASAGLYGRQVAQQYNWDSIARQQEAVYLSVLEERRRSVA